MKNHLLTVVTPILFILLSGCSSTPTNINQTVAPYGKRLALSNNYYAKVTKLPNDEYRVDSYNLSNGQIYLNDLSPLFDTKDVKCQDSLMVGEDVNTHCIEETRFFRTGTQTAGTLAMNTLGNAFVGVLTYGMASSITYVSRFDEEKYRFFVGQIDEHRSNTLQEFETVITNFKNQLQKDAISFDTKYNELLTNTENRKIQDKSGLYKGTFEIQLTRNKLYTNPKIDFTWTSAEDLAKQLSDLRKDILSYANIKIRCLISDYHFQTSTENCNQIWGIESETKYSKPVLTVETKNEYRFHLKPDFIKNQDLKVEYIIGGGLRFVNLTNYFLSIDSISLYLDDEVRGLKNLGIELSPQSYLKRPLQLSRFEDYDNMRTLRYVTVKSLDRKVEYGLAVKYKILDTDTEKTIFEKKKKAIKDLPKG